MYSCSFDTAFVALKMVQKIKRVFFFVRKDFEGDEFEVQS